MENRIISVFHCKALWNPCRKLMKNMYYETTIHRFFLKKNALRNIFQFHVSWTYWSSLMCMKIWSLNSRDSGWYYKGVESALDLYCFISLHCFFFILIFELWIFLLVVFSLWNLLGRGCLLALWQWPTMTLVLNCIFVSHYTLYIGKQRNSKNKYCLFINR